MNNNSMALGVGPEINPFYKVEVNMKKMEWINNNKMLFESDHKTFNRQIKCISTGNVIGDCVHSGCIRSYNEIECNGFTNNPGHLQNYDLGWLNRELHYTLKNHIQNGDKNQKYIGYTFFYWHGSQKIFIGWILTDMNHTHIKTVYARYNQKTISALDECQKYVVE